MNLDTYKETAGWTRPLLLLALVWLALIALLEPSGSSMVGIWERSETYAHGFLILPIALWLVWRKRRALRVIACGPDARALPFALALAGLWLAARLVGVMVVEHYALVGLLIVAVWGLFGWALVRALLFPLGYLLLMVPSGDSLINPLINFTADFTVMSVRLLDIPVYREGTFFILPTGEWSVVEACSGIRYFIASIVLGWLYAYLTYRTWWKRLAFGVAAIVVPVFANGARATLIVLIGHYSGMTLAVGVDHLIYGWVWFGIVMLAMFWIGNRWREDTQVEAPPALYAVAPRSPHVMAIVLVVLVAAFPLYERQLSSAAPAPSPLARLTPAAGWSQTDAEITTWRPRWVGMDDQRVLHLRKGDARVMLFVGWYGAQRQDAELINSENVLVPEKHPEWRKLTQSDREVTLGDQPVVARQALLHKPQDGQRLLVWQWHHIDGADDISDFRGKLRLAWSKLGGHGDAAAGILVAAPYKDREAEAEAVLQDFLRDLPATLAALDAVPAGAGTRP